MSWFHASPQEFNAWTGKLRKDWLMCLLKDTVDHLEKAMSSSTLLESKNTNIDEVKDVLVNKFDNPSPHPEASCKNDNYMTFDSMLRKSIEERDHDAFASKSVVFYNVVESKDDNDAVSDLMTTLKITQSYVKRSTRLGRKSAAIPPPRPRPIEVLLDCEHDKRLLMANAYLLKNSHIFVKLKLKW